MPRSCPSCDRELPDGQRFCGACGADVDRPAADVTATSITALPGATSAGTPMPDDGRFAPGDVIAGRYRIVGLLGRGGMGEVYRADDRKLGRPVALKFLPQSVEEQPGRLNRLLNEVRTALTVSHPNVCRVHDVQQEAGRHFITMEFVDGDDLSALLRRIGRLPPDKALEIARQLCAGVGAAHAAGVLHRDLKPANVMIDGRGQVKITDFGLAGLAGEFAGAEVRAGTPAYMAPEQLSGEGVTEASDIYALGLVLYELYTGKQPYDGRTAAEITRQRTSMPTSPSSHVTDIDPAVERVILRCLETDPDDRPRSALAVAAALPGGDPLADALAAGETPAPELVAEAGAVGGLTPRRAWALLAAFVLLAFASAVGNRHYNLLAKADPPRSHAVLSDRASEILVALGHDATPRDVARSFNVNGAYLQSLRASTDPDRWERVGRVAPPILTYGRLTSPTWIQFANQASVGDESRRPTNEPAGQVRLEVDLAGRLRALDVVSPSSVGDAPRESEIDWTPLLSAAGFDPGTLVPAEPRWLPARGHEDRAAWTGVYPDAPDVAVRLEAAAVGGRPTWFRIVEPWTPAEEEEFRGGGPGNVPIVQQLIAPVLYVLILVAGIGFAWRNVRLGRGDRRTAVRFALALTLLRFTWYLLTHHVPTGAEIGRFEAHLAWSMQRFGLAYIFYLAVEPYARKLWPRALTSWVRLFDGRLRDPLIGRDVLAGLALGAFGAAFGFAVTALADRMQLTGWDLHDTRMGIHAFLGVPGALLTWSGTLTFALLEAFQVMMFLVLVRIVSRRDWAAVVLVSLVLVGFGIGAMPLPLAILTGTVTALVTIGALYRFGLLTMVVTLTTTAVLDGVPLTPDLSAWWSTATWIGIVLFGGLAAWSFRVALAGRPVFRERLFDG